MPTTDPMVILNPTTTTPPLVIGPQQGVVGAGGANNVAFWQTSTTLTDSAGVTKPANQVFGGPASGAAAAPAFRALVAADIPAAFVQNPLTTTQDILVGGAAGAPARLGVGANGQALEVEAGLLVWQAALKSLGSQTVGVAQATIAHGLGRVPSICIAQMTSAGQIWRSAASDATNVYLTADAAGRTAEVYVR